MKSKLRILILLTAMVFGFQSCEVNDDLAVPDNLRIGDFVWKGLNLYYLWQNDAPDLADERFSNQRELNAFLSNNTNPTDLFNSLRVSPAIDRFSIIFSDYRTLEGVLSGTTKNNGVDFGLKYKSGSSTALFGWVRYILPNSDASDKNIQRGMIFYAINGIPLNVSNYQSLLANETYTLNFADYDNGNIMPNGQSISLTKAVYSENPILIANVITTGNHQIGYLMYNGFYPNYDSAMNTVFGQLKAQNITDLVLDLRYNSGGSIATATRLASMITGQFTGQLFAKEQWNDKLQSYYETTHPDNLKNNFTNTIGNATINGLNLNKVYILTSKSTASASELVINCLKPYITVVQIGEATTGKNVGSITLYDSPAFNKKDRNPSHFFAMQPIVLKVVNKNGFGDYLGGLPPDYPLTEDLGNLDILGSESEPLLSTAIGYITANGRMLRKNPQLFHNHFRDLKSLNALQSGMYLEEIPEDKIPIIKKRLSL